MSIDAIAKTRVISNIERILTLVQKYPKRWGFHNVSAHVNAARRGEDQPSNRWKSDLDTTRRIYAVFIPDDEPCTFRIFMRRNRYDI